MRVRPVALIGGVVVLAIACGKQKDGGGRPGPGVAHISFNCGTEEGASISVKPFRLELKDRKNGQLEWMLVGSDVDSVLLTPKATSTWPFDTSPPLIVRKSANGIAKGVPDSIPPGTYKYKITGFCIRAGGVVDTVGMDPDMIIPTLLEQQ